MKVSIGKFPKKVNGERKISVKIDPWDTWSMDHTLALIIHPMLIQLHKTKHGAPFVDDEDVPEELRSSAAPPKENDYDTDDNHFKRWDWVLDEMIWAFTQILDDDADSQFHSGKIDLQWKEVEVGGEKFHEMLRGPNDTHVYDKEGHDAWQARKTNGLKLFGRYFEALWD